MKTENNNPLSAIPFRNLKFIIRHWMIALSLALLAACTSENSWNAEDVCPESLRGNFQDKRDGKWYSYTTIGDQVWMAENLDYAIKNSNCDYNPYCDPSFDGKYPFKNTYNACPEGWYVPSIEDWKKLMNTLDGKTHYIKATSGWKPLNPGDDSNGSDECGFTAISYDGYTARWWTSTQRNHGSSLNNMAFEISGYREYRGENDFPGYSDLNSIRCVKD